MGDNRSRFRAERPAHLVTIAKPLAVGRYEVTFDEWKACREDGGCTKKPDDHKWGRGRRPVVNINWPEAVGYTRWLSRKTGKTYRLPSESEWEYLARAGTETEYWWGNKPGLGRANCRNCGPEISHKSVPVGSYKANPFGLFDVHGNVWEWVQDCWNPTYAGAPKDGSARLTGDCKERVTRSGSWYYVNTNVRSAYRSKFPADAYSYGIGIRVIRELP
jgi:formylglycine-generating enzyme required for sulfatase activity